jgi:hypothetical protein
MVRPKRPLRPAPEDWGMAEPTPERYAHEEPTGAEAPPPSVIAFPSQPAPPPPSGTILSPPEAPDPAGRAWFLARLWLEARLAVRMYFDPRYRISRTAQIGLPLVAVAMVANYFLFAVWFSIPVLSPVLERLLDAVLAVFAYRIVVRELDRYRAVLDYLARFAPR